MEELALLHRVGIQLVLVHDSQQPNRSSWTSSFPLAVSRKDLEKIYQQVATVNWEFLTKSLYMGMELCH